jgi:hypothetical protein
MARQHHAGSSLTGREHGDMLISAGVKVLFDQPNGRTQVIIVEQENLQTANAAQHHEETENKTDRLMPKDSSEVGRRIALDGETFLALDRLAKDRMSSLQELPDEAFRDLLKKHRRPTMLREMLRRACARIRPTTMNRCASAANRKGG